LTQYPSKPTWPAITSLSRATARQASAPV
jgi:hypothetical protein